MSLQAIVTMVSILLIIWGGLAITLHLAFKKEKVKRTLNEY